MMIPIDEVVHFDVTTHVPSTGAISDADATPTFDVYEEATDTGLLGATNLTKRTSLTGNYRGTFTASAANGFEAGKWYDVVVSATVDSVAGKTVAMHFRAAPAEVQAGVPVVDMTYIGGVLATATDIAATVWNALTSGMSTSGSIGKRLVDYITGDTYGRLGAPAGASVSVDIAAVKADTGNLVTRITSTLFTGITSLAQWLGLMAGKQVGDATARTELRATGAGSGGYDETTDAQEAIRDNMGTAQTGDSYAIVSSVTHGNAALKALLDAIKAKTDSLTFTVAGVVDANSLRIGGTVQTPGDLAALIATLTAYVDTEVAAIKAKTDNLPTDPADASDIAASFASIAASIATLATYVDTEVAAILAYATRTVIRGTVGVATTPSETQFTPSALSPAGVAADQFKGRTLIFDNDTLTPALRGQGTDITASSAAALPLLTFTDLTTPPAAGDTFSIV
jgi:hypothetical protein